MWPIHHNDIFYYVMPLCMAYCLYLNRIIIINSCPRAHEYIIKPIIIIIIYYTYMTVRSSSVLLHDKQWVVLSKTKKLVNELKILFS